jgi:hypothetical protein
MSMEACGSVAAGGTVAQAGGRGFDSQGRHPFSRTIALGFTQPLTERIRSLWGKARPPLKADYLTSFFKLFS